MRGAILLLAILLGAASYASFTAKSTIVVTVGQNWATKFCSSAHPICQYSYEMAYAAAALALLWAVLKFVSMVGA